MSEFGETASDRDGRLGLALACSRTGLYEWNFDTGVVFFSPEYYTLLGYAPGEFPATVDRWQALIHPDDAPAVSRCVAEYHAGRRTSHELRYRLRAKSGDWLWVRSCGQLVEGPPPRLFGSHVDVSEQCRLEAELRETRRVLELRVQESDARLRECQRLAAVGHAVAGAAHNARNLICTLGGGEFLLDAAVRGRDWGKVEDAAALLGRITRRLNLLILELLDHSKERPAERTVVSVPALLRELAAELRLCHARPGVRVDAETEEEGLEWRLDHASIERALLNLAVNSLDAMPGVGHLLLDARVAAGRDIPKGHEEGTPPADDERVLVLGVHDTGAGIAPECLPRIFDSWYSTKKSRGTGLGLPNVVSAVASHGGCVRVRSVPEAGTSFWLAIPEEG